MMAGIGIIGIVLGFMMLFENFLYGLIVMGLGAFFLWADISTTNDNNLRHKNDYGKAPTCYKCGSSRTYFMTYDDKRESINFWGAASSKIGKRYHCDNCGNEW